jgi:CheY-like chemotaxis protein
MSMSSPLETREVLVVDDEEDLGFSIALCLELAGYRVRTAATGQEALTLVGNREPDAIVLDIRLPDIDGWEVIHRLSKAGMFPRIPVVIISAYVDAVTASKAAALGCHAYLAKPFSTAELNRTVQAALLGTAAD